MINRIVEEIKVCLNTNCFIAALTTALTLPDICGRAEFPNKSTSIRYKEWYNKYVGEDEKFRCNKEDNLYLNGDLVYLLRNNTLHQGTLDIDSEMYNIQDFTLLVELPNSSILQCSTFCTEKYFVDGKLIRTIKKVNINVVELILKICKCAQTYYNDNKEKFEFMKDKITTISPQAKKMIIKAEKIEYCDYFQLDKKLKRTKWDEII